MTWYCDTIFGTMELNFVQSKDMGGIFSIETRKYAFFYEFCINADECDLDQCENDGYMKHWKYVPLNP